MCKQICKHANITNKQATNKASTLKIYITNSKYKHKRFKEKTKSLQIK